MTEPEAHDILIYRKLREMADNDELEHRPYLIQQALTGFSNHDVRLLADRLGIDREGMTSVQLWEKVWRTALERWWSHD